MCEPTTLMVASLALTAAGAASQMYGESQSKKAIGNAYDSESERQRKLTNESLGEFDKSLAYNKADAAQQREQAAASNLNNQYQQTIEQALAPAADLGASASASPKAIADSYRSAMDGAKARLQGQLAAKAQMGGFGDMLLNAQIQNQNVANTQNMLGGFMRGSSAILPLEVQKAQHAGDAAQNLGSLLRIAGEASGNGGSALAASSATKRFAALNANRAEMGLGAASSLFPKGTVGPGTF